MKRIIKKLVAVVLTGVLLVSTAMLTTFASEADDPFRLLEQQGFKIVTSVNVYSLENFDASSIDSDILFDQQAFVTVLDSQPEALVEAIYNGNILAVFDDSNELQQYEKKMGLSIGFEGVEWVGESSTHKPIGYIYQADEFGCIHITRINANVEEEEENSYAFAKELLDYEKRSANVVVQARGSLSTEYLGSIVEYYEGSEKKGDVCVGYEVSTAQGVDGYDYYTVHAYIDATPGRSLYGNKYDADLLVTKLETSTSDAELYKAGPDTSTGVTSYTVDVGFSGSKQNGIGGSADFSWTRDVPDVRIDKRRMSLTECEWEVDINDWSKAAKSTLSFEPGGTFRVKESNEELRIWGYTCFEVDAWNEWPSIAVSGGTYFYCSGDTVRD